MKTYDTYLFDADGTLFDTVDLVSRCFKHVAALHANITLTRRSILAGYGLPLKGQLIKLLGHEIDIDRVLDDYMDFQLEVIDKVSPFPGVTEELDKLKDEGKKLGIVTSRRRFSMERILDCTDTAKYFDTLVTPEDTDLHKPHPEPTLLALSRLNGDKASTLFTGDAEFDILSGTDAGVDTAFVDWSHIIPADLPVQPTWIIESFKDITAPL